MTQTLWNMSTTIRNPERLPEFLKVAALLDGKEWTEENQIKFQILLIQHRKYLNEDSTQTFNKLSPEQIAILKDKTKEMTYIQAKEIFEAKEYEAPSMRGRQSMNPLVKLGLINIDSKKIIHLTDVGQKLNNLEISWDEFVLDSLLKYQLSNPITEGYTNWNIKPFIGILHLINKINQLCIQQNQTPKGISTDEFGIFALSLSNYQDINKVASDVLSYRSKMESFKRVDYINNREYENARKTYQEEFIKQYLADFKNPVKNVSEYADSMKRYLRLTKYIYFRGKYAHQYIDLEPRRSIQIKSILEHDNAAALDLTRQEWLEYITTYGSYELPFETLQSLLEISKDLVADIHKIEGQLGRQQTEYSIPNTVESLKVFTDELREYRINLLNLKIKYDYAHDISKIDMAVKMLNDLACNRKNDDMVNKPSVELEKWTNIALNIINDAEYIKPNSPVGDDNEPTYTAPANVPDIECSYGSFATICEVTMLKGRDQWFNEGQPVMRHLREAENSSNVPVYCIFIAPSLHSDTLETYWTSVTIAYKGAKQRIIPLTIRQLTEILETVKLLKEQGKSISRNDMLNLYNQCLDLDGENNSDCWQNLIQNQLINWKKQLLLAA